MSTLEKIRAEIAKIRDSRERASHHDEADALALAVQIIDRYAEQEPKQKTGRWIKTKDGYMRCDQCGSRGSAIKARYCHHCGAEMKGGE